MINPIKTFQDYLTKRQLQKKLTSLYSNFCNVGYTSSKQGIEIQENLLKTIKNIEEFNGNSNLVPINLSNYKTGIMKGEERLERLIFQ